MVKNKIPCYGAIAGMIILSLTNFTNLHIAYIAVIVGVVFFFIDRALTRQPYAGSGFDIKAVPFELKKVSVWILIILPILSDAIQLLVGRLFLPEYTSHVLARADVILTFDQVPLLLIKLLVFSLGEEIAWRAFFQNQMQKKVPAIWAMVITSFLFCIGHITSGSPFIVFVDVSFVFINSMLYGLVFKKTNNAWISFIAHFLANLFSIIVLVLYPIM